MLRVYKGMVYTFRGAGRTFYNLMELFGGNPAFAFPQRVDVPESDALQDRPEEKIPYSISLLYITVYFPIPLATHAFVSSNTCSPYSVDYSINKKSRSSKQDKKNQAKRDNKARQTDCRGWGNHITAAAAPFLGAKSPSLGDVPSQWPPPLLPAFFISHYFLQDSHCPSLSFLLNFYDKTRATSSSPVGAS